MLDELSLLEADSIDTLNAAEAAVSESSASPSLPAPDFTGSLDYIDALARRSSITLSRRDLSGITTALNSFDYLSPLLDSKAVPVETERLSSSTDFRPLGDARRYSPEGATRAPARLSRSATEVGHSSIRSEFPPGFRNPLDPTRDVDDLNRSMADIERRINRRPFSKYFRKPNHVVICLKRKIRRQVMASMGSLGGFGFRIPRRTPYSRIIC